jgi:cytochrome c oxidase subunit 2
MSRMKGSKLEKGSPRRALPRLLAGASVAFLLPGCARQGIAPTSVEVHDLYYVIFALAGAVFVGVIGWLLFSIVRFRRRAGDEAEPPQREGRAPIVVLFFVIGLVIVATLFPFGERTLASVDRVDRNAQIHIRMQGFQWEWTAFYLDEGLVVTGKTLKQPLVFEVPVDVPVRMELVSTDVMHEFFLPDLLFMRNAVPGHPNVFTFTPTKLGTYQGQCAQFCGLWHSRMTFVMKVVANVDYGAWVTKEKAAVLLATCPPKIGSISITAKDISWNTNCLSVAAGSPVSLTVANQDAGIDHNFAIYDNPQRHERLFQTGRFSGVATNTYQLPTLPPGKYYFQCDVHGPAMAGVFIVSKPTS